MKASFKLEKGDKGWGEAVCMLLIFPVALLWYGYVTMTLWNWFIEPTGFERIGLAWAIGIRVMFLFMLPTSLTRKDLTLGQHIFTVVHHPLIALGLGWVAHSWM